MGVVYRAYDLDLERQVALKFLSPELLKNQAEKARLLQEARAAASLDHPNICTVHAIEEYQGQLFIAMACVDGCTLSHKLASGPLPPIEALRLALQIAEGLAAAHDRGIVHRDIKSANIMVTPQGQVKITDFGLALRHTSAVAGTASGRTLGTPAYVAPEQIRGEAVDPRADLWACGVVLYEMLTGTLPFCGENEHEMIFAILTDAPQPLANTRSEMPPGIQAIVDKCLQKDPARRFQTARELALALRRLLENGRSPGTPATPGRRRQRISFVMALVLLAALGALLMLRAPMQAGKPTLIVLDFRNETGEPELDHLAGMFTTALLPARHLAVLPRWRVQDILKQMGEQTGEYLSEALGRKICTYAQVDLLATGVVKKFGQRYTIELELRDAKTGLLHFSAMQWGDGQERIPEIIDRLALQVRLAYHEKAEDIRASQRTIAEITTGNLEAYQNFFRGEQLLNRMEFEKAEAAYRRAIALDSLFALAYYRLAYVKGWQLGTEQPAGAPLQKAIALMDRLPAPERFLLRAEKSRLEHGLQAYLQVLKQMEKIYPDHKEMLFNIGDAYTHLDRMREALPYLRRVVEMDPTFGRALQHLAMLYMKIKQYPPALAYAKRYVSVAASPDAYFLLAQIYEKMQDYAAGERVLREAARLYPENAPVTVALAAMLCLEEKIAEGISHLKALQQRQDDPRAVFWGHWGLAFAYPYQGRYRDALQASDWLVNFHRQKHDTLGMGIMQVYKGLLHIWGWGDTTAAWQEARKTQALQHRIFGYAYWLGYTMLLAYHAEFESARRVAGEKLPAKPWLQAFISSLQGRLQQAQVD
ncbi:MAG: serine/threonine protein kinase, partial [Calditrichaeota bacterium]